MKPFTKEHIDALDEFINAKILYILHKREGGWSNDNLNSDFDRLEEATNNLHALLVNDSEPDKEKDTAPVILGADFGNGDSTSAYGYFYNQEIYMLVPRVWSEEEKQAVRIAMCELFNNSDLMPSDSYPIAITKVFGGEK